MKKIIAVVVLLALFILAGIKMANKPEREYVRKYPLTVYEATKEIETEEETKKETIEIKETAQEDIKETEAEIATEPPVEDATEPSEDFTEEAEEVYVEDTNGSYLGYYELTAYTHTGNNMANGEYPYVGACACNSLDLGTVVYIEGYGTYTVCDRGGMPDNVIDIFMDTYDECVEFGHRGADVYLVE